MAETAQDVVNRTLREFTRYTGDGLPGEPVNAPLPVGDPSSGAHHPKKRDLRSALLPAVTAVDGAREQADRAAMEADRSHMEAGNATASEIAAGGYAAQAQLAALSAGAPLYTEMPIDFTDVPSPFLLVVEGGTQIFVHDGEAAEAVGWLSGETATFDTRAWAEAYDPGPRPLRTIVARFSDSDFVPGSSATYVETAEEPEDFPAPAKIMLAGERWYRFAGPEFPLSLGAKSDGVTDNSSFFEDLSNIMGDYDRPIVAERGIYKTNRSLKIPRRSSLIGKGSGETRFDAKDSAGAFDLGVILVRGAAPVALPKLSASPLTGDSTLSFVSAHGLYEGARICLSDNRPYSYTPWSDSYKSGEYAVVRAVLSSTVVLLTAPLYSDFALKTGVYPGAPPKSEYLIGTAYNASEVDVSLCEGFASGLLEGFSVIAPGAANGFIAGLSGEFCADMIWRDLKAVGATRYSATLTRAHHVRGSYLEFVQRGLGPGGYQYGLNVGSVQDIDFGQIYVEGHRHAIATGNSPDPLPVVNRELVFHHGVCTSVVNGVLDWHQNAEWCRYENLHLRGVYGVVSSGGNHNTLANITFDLDDIFMNGAGMTGLDLTLENVRGRSRLGKSVSNGSVFSLSAANTYFTDNVMLGGTLRFLNVSCVCPAANEKSINMIQIRNRGFVGTWDLHINGLDFDAPGTTGHTLSLSGVEGTPARSVRLNGVTKPKGGSAASRAVSMAAFDLGTPVFGLEEGGRVSLSATTGVSSLNTPVLFPTPFPKAPNVIPSIERGSTGAGDKIHAFITNRTALGFTFWVERSDDASANFAASATVPGAWHAFLKETA